MDNQECRGIHFEVYQRLCCQELPRLLNLYLVLVDGFWDPGRHFCQSLSTSVSSLTPKLSVDLIGSHDQQLTADVSIRGVPATPVAIMEHRGDPETLEATIQRFIRWRKAAGLHPRTNGGHRDTAQKRTSTPYWFHLAVGALMRASGLPH